MYRENNFPHTNLPVPNLRICERDEKRTAVTVGNNGEIRPSPGGIRGTGEGDSSMTFSESGTTASLLAAIERGEDAAVNQLLAITGTT